MVYITIGIIIWIFFQRFLWAPGTVVAPGFRITPGNHCSVVQDGRKSTQIGLDRSDIPPRALIAQHGAVIICTVVDMTPRYNLSGKSWNHTASDCLFKKLEPTEQDFQKASEQGRKYGKTWSLNLTLSLLRPAFDILESVVLRGVWSASTPTTGSGYQYIISRPFLDTGRKTVS